MPATTQRFARSFLLAAVSTFFGRGIVEIMPAFAALIFDGGSSELAALMAAAGDRRHRGQSVCSEFVACRISCTGSSSLVQSALHCH